MSDLPTGIRASGNRLHMRIRRPDRGWEWETTGLGLDELDTATKLRATTQAIIDTGDDPAAFGRMTVRAYSDRWIKDRRKRKLKSVGDDKTRLTLHVLAHKIGNRDFGAMYLDEVRPMHCRALMRAVGEKDLAPRTVLNVQSVANSMFMDAVADELLPTTPWVIPRKERPKKRDKDPKWRATAKFDLNEMRRLLWAKDEDVPPDRRVFYALCYFGAKRFGEASARRWDDRLVVDGRRAIHIHNQYATDRGEEDDTKTESVRLMPEHPTLTAILADWHAFGWRAIFGRHPRPDDLIVPSRRMVNRSSNHMNKKFKQDLGRLKMRVRRQHDLRRSFIGHAVDAGATRDRLKPGTHGLGSSVLEMYDSPEWVACFNEVIKLRLDEPIEAEIPLAMASGDNSMGRPWGGNLKMSRTGGFDAFKWRGGRDSNPKAPLRLVRIEPSDFGHIDASKLSGSRRITTGEGVILPILPIDIAAMSLVRAVGGNVDAAIAALRSAASRGGGSP